MMKASLSKVFEVALFSLIAIFGPILARAQSNYKPGLVVSNNGDTLKGWIDYRNWRVNPGKISFRANPADQSGTIYSVSDIRYFQVTGEDIYKRAMVRKDMRPVRLEALTKETKDSTITDTVFLRMLAEGPKLSLYELVDFKDHYYIQEAGKDPQELSLIFNLSGEEGAMFLNEQDGYRDQLREYLPAYDSTALNRAITRARYVQKDLTGIVIRLNGGAAVVTTPGSTGQQRGKIRFYISAGAAYSSLHNSGNQSKSPIGGLNGKGTIAPVFSAGIDLQAARNLSDFTLRVEVGYSKFDYKAEGYSNNPVTGERRQMSYAVKQQNISPALSLLYNFLRTPASHFYGGIGVAYNLSSYTGNTYTNKSVATGSTADSITNYIDLLKSWPSIFLRAGARINRQWELGLTGDIMGSFTDYANFSVYSRSYALRVAYFF